MMTQALLFTSTVIFGFAFVCLLMSWFRSSPWARAGNYFLDLGFLLLCAILFLEAMDVGVFLPVANRHQAMVFFAWSVLLVFLFVRRGSARGSFGLVLLPLVTALVLSAAVGYSTEVKIPLKYLADQIFAVHTISAFLAYAAFAISFVTSILYLLQHRALKSRRGGSFYQQLPNLEELENIAFFTILLGVPLMTVTLITGFIWAKGEFGHYWVWEPKIVLAIVTWLVYSALLYIRYVRSMHGSKVMRYLLFSFSSVLVTFLGSGVFYKTAHSIH